MFPASVLGFAIICVIALIANRRFRHLDRLPMQWGFNGQVNWTASRPVALAFIPVLYGLVAIAFIFAATQDPLKFSFRTMLIWTVPMIGMQILHLFMISWSDKSGKR